MRKLVFPIVCLLAVALTLGVFAGMKYTKRASSDAEWLETSLGRVAQEKGYEENAAFWDYAVGVSHEKAFAEAYDIGGLRTPASFDEPTYNRAFFHALCEQIAARQDREALLELVLSSADRWGVRFPDAGDR